MKKDLSDLEKEGILTFNSQLQAARSQQEFKKAAEIEQVLAKWQKDTADFAKLLSKKSPQR